MKKKIILPILMIGTLIFGGISIRNNSSSTSIQNRDDLKEYTYDACRNDTNGKSTLRNMVTSDGIEYSQTYIQYAQDSSGLHYMRFATAFKGSEIDSISYVRSEITGQDGTIKSEEEHSITTIYKYLIANDTKTYYNGSQLVPSETESTLDYYWACFTIRFSTSNYVDSEFSVSLKVNGSTTENIRTTSLNSFRKDLYENEYLAYKVEGESLANKEDGKTNYVENFTNIFDTSGEDVYGNKKDNAKLKYEEVSGVQTSNNKSLGGLIKHSIISLHMWSDFDATVDFLMRAASTCRVNTSSKIVKDFYFEKDGTEYVEMKVNGTKIDLTGKYIPGHTTTASWSGTKDWFSWATVSLGNINLKTGDNLITLELLNTGNLGYKSSNGGAAFFNVDYFAAAIKTISSKMDIYQNDIPTFANTVSYTLVDEITFDQSTYLINTGIDVLDSTITYTDETGKTITSTSDLQNGENVITANFNGSTQSYVVNVIPLNYIVQAESFEGSAFYNDKYYMESTSSFNTETVNNKTYLGKINKGAVMNFHAYGEFEKEYDLTLCAASACYNSKITPYTIFDVPLNKLITLSVNGEPIEISDNAILPGNTTKNWYNTRELSLGKVKLHEGDNVITITIINDGKTLFSGTGGTLNLDFIAFREIVSVYMPEINPVTLDENGHATNLSFTPTGTAIDGTEVILTSSYTIKDDNGAAIDQNTVFTFGQNLIATLEYYGLTYKTSINIKGQTQLKIEAEKPAELEDGTMTYDHSLIESMCVSYETLTTENEASASNGVCLGNTVYGSSLTLTINAKASGTIDLYLCGSSVARTGTTSGKGHMLEVLLSDVMTLSHNGNNIAIDEYSSFAGYPSQNWFNWDLAYLADIELVEGTNTITLTIIQNGAYVDRNGEIQGNGNPKPINLDYILVEC